MKRFFFLEYCDSAFTFNCEEGDIVSLDPSVSYLLQKKKIRYYILEDYYDEGTLRSAEADYFFEQLKWFDSFDNFIEEDISYCRRYSIPIAKSNYLRLKYFVDTIMVYSYILYNFFQINKDIKEIIYTYKSCREDNKFSIFELKSRYCQVFSDLLRLFCGKNNVRFTSIPVKAKDIFSKEYFFRSCRENKFFKSQMKKIINFYKYKKLHNIILSDTSLKDLNILFMHAGSLDIDCPIKEAIKRKAHVYVKEKSEIVREDYWLRWPMDLPELDECFVKRLKKESDFCADNLEKNAEIISWINDKCLMDVSSIVLPFLQYFISQDCSYILQESERMFRFYKQNKIDYVFARGNTDRDSLAYLVAAKYLKGAKSVCIQHSNFAIDNEVFGVFEIETYNYTFAREYISENYFKYSLENIYKSDCKVFRSSHYLRNVEKKYYKNKEKMKVVYVEKKFPDKLKCFNNMLYPLAWYYEFQRRLIDFFAKESRVEFVYKHASSQGWAGSSVLKHIKNISCKNISIYDKHLLKSLKFADRVIVDYPSSALFEAAVAGKPVLCVCANYFRIIKQAKEVFGKSIQQFSSIDEAILLIREFLYGNPQEYIVNIPLSKNDFLDVFKEVNSTSKCNTRIKDL